MSGPKYYDFKYDFSFTSHEEAAGVMAQLSACGFGVSARVSGNQIKFVVSESARYDGMDYAEISKRVNQAQRAYEHNLELKRILEEKKQDSKILVSERKAEIEKEYAEERRKIEFARAETAKLRQASAFSVDTPFGRFDLGDVQSRVLQTDDDLKKDAEKLEKNKKSALEKINEAAAYITHCESISELNSCRSKITSASVGSFLPEAKVEILSSEVKEKTEKLKRFKQASDKLCSALKQEGLQGYFERIKAEIAAIDVFSDGAAEKIDGIVRRIKTEVAVLKERQADDERRETIDAGVKDAVAALEEIGNLLKFTAKEGVAGSVTAADYTEKSKEAIQEIEKILTDIKGLSFVNGENKGIIERLKRDYVSCKNSAASMQTVDRLQRTLATLRTVEKDCIKGNEIYLDFKREYDRYEGLFIRAQAFFGGEGQSIEGVMPSPVEITLSYDNPEQKIKELKERNDEIEKEIEKCEQEAVCAAMSAAVSVGNCGKKFRKERSKNGDLHFTFVREDTKGVIFDVDCMAGGKTCIYPRGVVLCNGKSTITPEQLRAAHSSCTFAKDIHDTLSKIGLTESGDYKEAEGEVKESMYDEKNYYHIDSFEESVRYLELSGFSKTEINEILEVETGDEQERQRKRAAVATAQKAIKPQ